MVERGWSRTYINAQVNRIRRIFKWAASEQLLPSSIYNDLCTVSGLRAGKTEAREPRKVKPVPEDMLQATVPLMSLTVRAMVKFQQLTGGRPDEVCALRPQDLDMSNPKCWVYTPSRHKTQHHGHDRFILIGPRAQEVLRPFLGTKLDAYCFSPAAEEDRRNAERKDKRQTPMTPSQRARAARQVKRRRAPGGRYEVTSYRNSIYRACDRAFPPPESLAPHEDESKKKWLARLTAEQKADLTRWRSAHRWHPNRLRHNRGSELRAYGLDLAKTVLGHAKVETTQIYAEKDFQAAMELVSRIG
jgi:integrase